MEASRNKFGKSDCSKEAMNLLQNCHNLKQFSALE